MANLLTTNKEDLLAATSQTTAAVEEMRGNVEHIYKSNSNILDSVNGIKGKIDSFDDKIGRQVKEVSEIIIDIKSKLSGITQITAKATTQATTAEEAIATFKTFDQATKGVLEAIEFIGEVSEKIRVLTFNAKIEATHCGAAGKGFFVIADEMERLTESTKAKAEELVYTINDSLNTIEELANSNEQALKSSLEIARDLEKTQGAIEEMAVGLDGIESDSESLIADTKEIRSNIDDINNAMLESNNALAEHSAAITQIQDAAVSINKLIPAPAIS